MFFYILSNFFVLYNYWASKKCIFAIIRGFNDAVNGFTEDGWSLMSNDGVDDVTIAINSSPNKLLGSSAFFCAVGGVLCVKASMLLQVSLINLRSFSILD